MGARTSKAFATRAFPLINDSIGNGDLLQGLFRQTEITSFFSFGLVVFLLWATHPHKVAGNSCLTAGKTPHLLTCHHVS